MIACVTNSNSRRHYIASQISKIHLPKQHSLKFCITMQKKNTEQRIYLITYQFERENISTPPPPHLLTTTLPPNLCQILSVSTHPNYYTPPQNYEFEIKCLPPLLINSTPLQSYNQEGEYCACVIKYDAHLSAIRLNHYKSRKSSMKQSIPKTAKDLTDIKMKFKLSII